MEFDRNQFFRAGVLTALVSVGVVQLIRIVAVAILHPSARFVPLTLFPPTFDTAIGVAGAVFVFLQIAENAARPIRTYRKIAAGVLLVSFAPDIAIPMRHVPGAGWPEAFALMSMHVAVWAICVTMLPRLVASKSS
ncbi:MAG TPA: hypothetical protein VHZ25_09355 [Acidobacteriaceae bacterium]|jgi:hypothetical protein|nr:hypothetical protein [Acidobacteriaceae bacterium]